MVQALGSLIGIVAGVYFASRYYEVLANWLIKATGWGENFSKVLVFIIAFILINRFVGLLLWIINKVLSLITRLPFIRSVNHLLGLVLGLMEGVIVLGVVFYFIAKIPLSASFMSQVTASKVAPFTVQTASILWPLLPEALRMLKSAVSWI